MRTAHKRRSQSWDENLIRGWKAAFEHSALYCSSHVIDPAHYSVQSWIQFVLHPKLAIVCELADAFQPE
jgi:hypothetical protein